MSISHTITRTGLGSLTAMGTGACNAVRIVVRRLCSDRCRASRVESPAAFRDASR